LSEYLEKAETFAPDRQACFNFAITCAIKPMGGGGGFGFYDRKTYSPDWKKLLH
jgi:hypothetical protein